MSAILDDIKKFRELLNQTPKQLNEHFFFNQDKQGGQAVPPQDKLGNRPDQGVAKNPKDYKDMMTDPKMADVKKSYAAGGPKGELPESDKPVYTNHDFSNVERAVRPIYQRVQGLVPSFADPVRSYLLQAQKSLLAALEVAEKNSVGETDYSDLEEASMINENQKVQILGWNSTQDGNIDNWAKDPESFREVIVDKLTMDSRDRPILKFMELDGSGPYRADWNQKYGWVADFA